MFHHVQLEGVVTEAKVGTLSNAAENKCFSAQPANLGLQVLMSGELPMIIKSMGLLWLLTIPKMQVSLH